MLNKLYKKSIKIIKENLVAFILLVFLLLNIFVTLPYGIYRPGGTINIDERLSNKKYDSKGSFNMTYVNYQEGKITNLLIALLMPGWDIESIDKIKYTNEDLEAMNNRERIQLYESISNAKYVAYTASNKDFNITDKSYHISFIDESVKTELKTGDILLSVDGHSYNELDDYLANIPENTELKVKVIRNKKEKEVKTITKIIDGKVRIGIYLTTILTYDDDLEYNYKNNESGSSGGLMLTLAIYNSLTKEDITKGMKICGTGTIDLDGNVGEIGSVKHKISGAIKDKCDIFLVPKENYQDASDEIKRRDSNMKLYEVNTFNEALEILK